MRPLTLKWLFRSLPGWTWLGLALGCGGLAPGRLETVALAPFAADRDQAAAARAATALEHSFPPEYRALQRAIITLRGKQFTCDALLTASRRDGHHLALVSSLGVVADVCVRPDGERRLQKITPLLRESWSRDFVARDLQLLFVLPVLTQPGGRLPDGRLVLQTAPASSGDVARYIFSPSGERWEGVEVLRQGQCCYRALVRNRRSFPGSAALIPCEFEVEAGVYRLELRITRLTTTSAPASEDRS